MLADKTTMNLVRKNLEKTINDNERDIETARSYLTRLAIANASSNETIKKIARVQLAEELGIDLPPNTTLKDFEAGILKAEMDVRRLNEKTKSILANLSREGFKDVTYSLPFYILSNFGFCLSYSYLLVSGIKKNAQSKTLDGDLIDEVEISLLDYEMNMSKYIEEDLSIDTSFITEFITTLLSYLYFYYDENKRMFDRENFDFHEAVNSILVNMGFYIVYAKTGHKLVKKERDLFYGIYIGALRANFTVGEAIRYACLKMIGLIEDKKRDAIEAREKATVAEVPIQKLECFEYIENGIVVKVCDIERFRGLLDETDLSESKKREYVAQMVNLKNRLAEEDFDRRMREQRERLLSTREMHLYNLAWSSSETSKDAKYVDDVIEMMLSASNEDEVTLLMEELFPVFARLSQVFEAKKADDVPKVMFLTETVTCEEGSFEKPKILSSIAKIMKGELKQVSLPLKKLLEGFTGTDREFKCNGLPCRVWYKGKDYKVFYTLIGEVVVILDVFKGSEAFARIRNMAVKADFAKRMSAIREYLSEGNEPNEIVYIDMVNRELEGTKVFVKKQ